MITSITSSDDVLALVVAAMLGSGATASPPTYATNAGPRVFAPRDWPTQPTQFPLVRAWVVREGMQGTARSGAPSFTVTTTIGIVAETSALAQANDAGAGAAAAAATVIDRQIKVAVINGYPLMSLIQQIARVDSQYTYRAADAHFAGVQILMDIEWFASPSSFQPMATVPLAGVDLTVERFPPTSLSIDLPQ